MVLFDEVERTYTGPSNHNEEPYDYYTRSARPDVAIIRDVLNRWFMDYPDSEKFALKNAFRKQFDESFFELFVYQVFSHLGFSVDVHPALIHSSKRPDFLVISDTIHCYVEATVTKDKSKAQLAMGRKLNQFYDDFSAMRLRGFVLVIDELIIKSKNQPSAKPAVAHIEKTLAQHDSVALLSQLQAYGHDILPEIAFENDDLKLKVRAIPSDSDEDMRPIGIYPHEAFVGGGEEALKKAIDYKGRRYGKLDKPFILCLNCLDIKSSGGLDWQNTIWGSLALAWSDNPSDRNEKFVLQNNGAFRDDKGPRLKDVSVILLTKVSPHSIPVANYCFYINPFANHPIDIEKLQLNCEYIAQGKITKFEGKHLSDVLGISRTWLDSAF